MRTKLRSKISLLFVLCAVLLAIPVVAALAQDTGTSAAPTIQSDKADYKPGELVTLTGGNWQPGESVNIKVNDTYGATWSRNVDVTADSSGNVTDQFNLPNSFVSDYDVTATGAQSGTATTSFTDGNINVAPDRAPASGFETVARGTSYDVTATHTKQGGGSDPVVNTPIQVTNVAGTNKVPPTCGTAGTMGTVGTTIPQSWLSVVSPTLPQTIGDSSNTAITFRVSPPANAASGNYAGAVNLTTTNGGAETFDLCLTVPNTVNTTTTASNASATYGDPQVWLDATVTPASGTVNNGSVSFTVKNGTTALGTVTDSTVVNNSARASFPISAGLFRVNAAKYTIEAAYTAGSGFNNSDNSAQSPKPELTVNKATLNVNADNNSKTYGAANPTNLTYGFSGFVNSETSAAGLTGSANCSIDASAGPNAGTYTDAITCAPGNLSSTNYSFVTGSKGTFTIAKATGSVSITNIPNNATFGGSFTPSYTKDGDGATSVVSNTPSVCSVSGGDVNYDAAGTCKLQAKVAEGTNHLAATGAEQSFTIAKAQATLTLSGLTGHTYSGSPQGATVTTTVNNTPVNISGVSVTYNGSATVPKDAGSYTVVASLDNPNYQATSVSDTLVIGKKSLTVTAEDQQSTFGAASLPANTATYTNGFVNNEGPSVLGGTLSYDYYQNNNLVANPQNAGTYAIRPSGLTSGNYQINFADGTLTIKRAAGSVSITNLPTDAVYNGSFTPTYTKDGDGATSVTSLTSGTCSVDSSGDVNFVGVGTCTLKSAVAQGTNYEAATNQQSFEIAKAHATLSLSNLTGHTYSGSPQGATVATNPTGLNGVSVTYNGSATVPTNAGSYSVVASLNNANYEADNATGTLVIDKKSLTVTANNQQSTYNDASLPANSVTYTNGFVNNEGPGVLSGTLSYNYYQNGNQVTPQNAGTYAIRPSGLTSGNYQINFADGTLTIQRATGSVSITNLPTSAVLNGSFTPNVSASGDGATSVTSLTSGTCTVSAGVVSFVGAGTCTLKSAVAQGTNYEAATNQQSFGIGFNFVGFAAPVDNTNSYMNVLKAGQAIPLKWRLTDANNQPVTNLAGVTVTAKTLSCSIGATDDLMEEVAAGGSGLQNLGNGYYQFNWASPKSYASSCKTLHLDLGEKDATGNPVTHTAQFRFTK